MMAGLLFDMPLSPMGHAPGRARNVILGGGAEASL